MILLASQVDKDVGFGVRVMVCKATFNNISVISWWPVLLVETRGTGEYHRPVTKH